MTGIQNDLKPGYAKLKGGPKENAKGEVESPLKIEVKKAFTTKLSSLSSMGARPHSPGCAILTQIHY